MQETVGAWQYTKDKNIDMSRLARGGAVDFAVKDGHPFDPFNSPLSGPGLEPADKQIGDWAKPEPNAAYYKHTHGKGGNPHTVGVWDQTYSSPETVKQANVAL